MVGGDTRVAKNTDLSNESSVNRLMQLSLPNSHLVEAVLKEHYHIFNEDCRDRLKKLLEVILTVNNTGRTDKLNETYKNRCIKSLRRRIKSLENAQQRKSDYMEGKLRYSGGDLGKPESKEMKVLFTAKEKSEEEINEVDEGGDCQTAEIISKNKTRSQIPQPVSAYNRRHVGDSSRTAIRLNGDYIDYKERYLKEKIKSKERKVHSFNTYDVRDDLQIIKFNSDPCGDCKLANNYSKENDELLELEAAYKELQKSTKPEEPVEVSFQRDFPINDSESTLFMDAEFNSMHLIDSFSELKSSGKIKSCECRFPSLVEQLLELNAERNINDVPGLALKYYVTLIMDMRRNCRIYKDFTKHLVLPIESYKEPYINAAYKCWMEYLTYIKYTLEYLHPYIINLVSVCKSHKLGDPKLNLFETKLPKVLINGLKNMRPWRRALVETVECCKDLIQEPKKGVSINVHHLYVRYYKKINTLTKQNQARPENNL